MAGSRATDLVVLSGELLSAHAAGVYEMTASVLSATLLRHKGSLALITLEEMVGVRVLVGAELVGVGEGERAAITLEDQKPSFFHRCGGLVSLCPFSLGQVCLFRCVLSLLRSFLA